MDPRFAPVAQTVATTSGSTTYRREPSGSATMMCCRWLIAGSPSAAEKGEIASGLSKIRAASAPHPEHRRDRSAAHAREFARAPPSPASSCSALVTGAIPRLLGRRAAAGERGQQMLASESSTPSTTVSNRRAPSGVAAAPVRPASGAGIAALVAVRRRRVQPRASPRVCSTHPNPNDPESSRRYSSRTSRRSGKRIGTAHWLHVGSRARRRQRSEPDRVTNHARRTGSSNNPEEAVERVEATDAEHAVFAGRVRKSLPPFCARGNGPRREIGKSHFRLQTDHRTKCTAANMNRDASTGPSTGRSATGSRGVDRVRCRFARLVKLRSRSADRLTRRVGRSSRLRRGDARVARDSVTAQPDFRATGRRARLHRNRDREQFSARDDRE